MLVSKKPGKKVTPVQLTAKFKNLSEELRLRTAPEGTWLVLKPRKLRSPNNKTDCVVVEPEAILSCEEYAKSKSEKKESSSTSSTAFSSSSEVIIQLHDLCSSPSSSLEMIRIYISTYPWALKQKNAEGNLPLHLAIDRDDSSCLIVCELLRGYSESASIRDSVGNTPLFMACSRPRMNVGVMKALYHAHPGSASSTCFGSLPLHGLTFSGNACPEAMKFLLSVNPLAASTPNNFGNLPLHYLCAMENPSTESVRLLMAAYPQAVTIKNNYDETPIERALQKYGNSEAVRERMRLLLRAAAPECLSEEQVQLVRQLNWEARRIIILMCVHFVGQVHMDYEGLMHLYSACGGVWRHIIAYL